MKELDEIDQLFQTTLEGFESTPDPSVKENIDRAIASKKKRRKFLFILFPVLFSTALLAALLSYQTGSGKANPEQNFIAQEIQTDSKPPVAAGQKDQNTQRGQNQQQTLSRYGLTGSKSSKGSKIQSSAPHPGQKVQSEHRTQQQITIERNQKYIPKSNEKRSPGAKNTSTSAINQTTDPETKQPESLGSIAGTTNQPGEKPESNAVGNNSLDSLTASTPEDSSKMTDLPALADEPGLIPEVKKAHQTWSVSVITGWENEIKRPAGRFDSLDLSLVSKEFARIHSTSFYGKIEFNRRINARMDAVMGLGFHSARITQYGSLHTLDSFSVTEGATSSPPPLSYEYAVRQQNGSRIYQVNSIILPLGISYSAPLGNTFRLRISGGTQLAYSWMTEKQSSLPLTAPGFRPFGLNAWLRPEIHYNFGKFQLFGFGTFNQALVRQLKWDFTVRRNPAFGAGIGLLIRL